jgi:hypothetical protein
MFSIATSVAEHEDLLPENTLELALRELIEAYGYDAVDTVVEQLSDSYSHMPRGHR